MLPTITYCMKKASAENETLKQIGEVLNRSGLPYFMRVDILRAALVEEQQKAYGELSADSEQILRGVVEHYEEELRKMSEAAEKEKGELIKAFEDPDSHATADDSAEEVNE